MKKRKPDFATLYYTDARGGLPVSTGSPYTEVGNRLSAMRQVFALQRFRRVEVVDRKSGTFMFVITLTTDGRPNVNYEVAGQVAKNFHWREKMREPQRKR